MLLFLLLVLVTSVCAGQCPISCKCKDFLRDNLHSGAVYTTITCGSDINITASLPETTHHIILHDVLESDLNYVFDSVANLPYFHHLTVTSSTLTDLSNITFEGLEHLQSLDLSSCKIPSLPFGEGTFNLSSLQTLDLSHNELKDISGESFRTFTVLEVLNLSANSVDKFSSNSFNGLVSLKCLDLTENNLANLDDRVLRPLVSLQHLNLSKNHLEVLNEACFSSLLHLQQLDVSWNRLARVAPGSLQLPSLARLMLAGNPKLGGSREPALLVGTGRRLQTVDASRTGLKQVPAALTHSIRTLRLAGNSISLVKRGDLDSYPLLQLLDFTSNDLELIEDDALGRLESLTVLYLTDNKLQAPPKSLPERLRILHLENNQIKQIEKESFEGLPLLEVLLLSNNKITAVKENSFIALGSLATLDLSRNPITTLPPGSLSGPRELRLLKLSNIEIVSPENDMTFPLSTPEHLVTLDLAESPGLAHQLIADTATLAAARELQELNLSGGGIRNVRSDLLHFLPQLRNLQLQNNPLNCTDLHWLAVWMRRQDEEEYRKVTCSTPAELWGTLLVDLQDTESELNYKTTEQSINQTIQPPAATNSKPFIQEASKLTNVAAYNTSSSLQSTESANPAFPNRTNAHNASGPVTSPPKLTKMSDDGTSAAINLIKEAVADRTRFFTPRIGEKITDRSDGHVNTTENQKYIKGSTEATTEIAGIEKHSRREEISLKVIKGKAVAESGSANRTPTKILSDLGNVLRKPVGMNWSTDAPHNLFIVSKGRPLNKKVEKAEVRDSNMNEIYSAPYGIGNTAKGDPRKTGGVMGAEAVGVGAQSEIAEEHQQHRGGENVTSATGEMSMYSGEFREAEDSGTHPGMFILAAGILTAAVAMALLTSRIARQRRNRMMAQQQEDIEVSSLPSVTELW